MQTILANPQYSGTLIRSCRAINNHFSFAGIGIAEGDFIHFPTGGSAGPPVVAITGRTYHRIRDASFTQHSIHWFLYDETARQDSAIRFGISSTIIQAIADDLRDANAYVHTLSHLQQPSRTPHVALELRDVSSNGDFAAVMHAADSTDIQPRSVVIYKRGEHGQPTFVNILSRHYEPMHYVLFFPHGEPGWGLTTLDGVSQLSQIKWYRSRPLAEQCFMLFGRLTCEYLVDMYSRVEEERLAYISRERHHQLLQERQQHADDESDNGDWNNDIHLPASFVGSRAWASEQTADSLALARMYGKPSFFATMTFNPNWPEVTARLLPGQTASDIPVVCARVFKLRLQAVLRLIKTRFGHILYLIRVIEFQKRGFPHCHMVFKVCTYNIYLLHIVLPCTTGSS